MIEKKGDLGKEIWLAYKGLIERVGAIPLELRGEKRFEGTGGKVSVVDLVAYQIGWGSCLIGWYEAGIKGEMVEMPGEGFKVWDYVGIARSFYQKYSFDGAEKQLEIFGEIVVKILGIVEKESELKRLDLEGVWAWCALASGKAWPLSKWIRVNTVAPYQRASRLIKKGET